jgi:hypothetical protein
VILLPRSQKGDLLARKYRFLDSQPRLLQAARIIGLKINKSPDGHGAFMLKKVQVLAPTKTPYCLREWNATGKRCQSNILDYYGSEYYYHYYYRFCLTARIPITVYRQNFRVARPPCKPAQATSIVYSASAPWTCPRPSRK